jgi:TolB-like protein
MTDPKPQRRLAATLVADVVGYSRLMEADETGTLAALKERRKTILEPVVKAHGGRTVKLMGDGVLIEFASAVEAVEAAVDLQARFAAADEGIAEARRIVLRIGINLGDVVGEGDDIFGDGVNVAARLEALAGPGGICVSAKVHEEVRSKAGVTFEDIGERQLKNIATPVRVFGWGPAGVPSAPVSTRPSIAILPFDNMSGDPEQQYFSDGVTEDIITALSRFRSLFVIARNSSFAFRGQAITVSDIARRLGVGYVLEGSVRRSGSRVRITAQLIEAASGNHVWSERYDRGLEDVFAVQDEVARVIAWTLAAQVEGDIASRAQRQRPENHAAYDYALRGIELQQRTTRQDTDAAIPLLEKAIDSDPAYAEAHAWLALCHIFYRSYDLDISALERACALAERGVRLDGMSARCHVVAGYCAIYRGQFEEAEFHHSRAASLNSNEAHIAVHMVAFLAYAGRAGESESWFATARMLTPLPPVWYPMFERIARYCLGQFAEAAVPDRGTSDDVLDLLYVTASLGQLGRAAEARASLARCQSLLSPGLTLRAYAEAEPYRERAGIDHLLDGLRKAGLPE